jgi:hypothetical protein
MQTKFFQDQLRGMERVVREGGKERRKKGGWRVW